MIQQGAVFAEIFAFSRGTDRNTAVLRSLATMYTSAPSRVYQWDPLICRNARMLSTGNPVSRSAWREELGREQRDPSG